MSRRGLGLGEHFRGLMLLGICAIGTVSGLAQWAATPDRIPATLQQASGEIRSVVQRGRRSASSGFVLSLRDHGQRFRYPRYYPQASRVQQAARVGRRAEVLHAPNAFGTGVDVWGLAVDGWSHLTPQQALRARRAQAPWFALQAGLFFGLGALLLRFASPLDLRGLRRRSAPAARREPRRERRKRKRSARKGA